MDAGNVSHYHDSYSNCDLIKIKAQITNQEKS